MMRKFLAVFTFVCAVFGANFPQLSGRVVDDAQILSTQTKQELETTLENFEQNSSTQIVVATIKSLNGADITSYSNELARTWGIGQKGKDNGVVMLVALNERKVRIEVGYGLESELTDAIASTIIQREILPKFRQNDYNGGVRDGVLSILAATDGSFTADPKSDANEPLGDMPLTLAGALAGFVLTFISGLLKNKNLTRVGFSLVFSGILSTAIISTLEISTYSWQGIGIYIFMFIVAYIVFSGIGKGGGKNFDDDNFTDTSGSYGNKSIGGDFSRGGFNRSSKGGGFRGGGGGFGGGGASGSW